MTDSRWVEESLRQWSRERKPEALGELLKAQRDRAYSLAVRLGSRPEDAEDVVQEAFIKVMSREKGFGNAEEFDATVCRAVFQCSVDALRSGRRRERREAEVGRQAAAELATQPETEAEMSTEESSELRARVRAAVRELPEETRFPVVLCHYQGLSESRAAEVLEVPRSTLRRRLAAAMDDLRRRVGDDRRKLGTAALLALMAGEPVIPAPASLCAALDLALPGRACAEIPALTASGGFAAASAAAFPAKTLLAALAGLAGAACLTTWLCVAGHGGPAAPGVPSQDQQVSTRHPDAANVRPVDGGPMDVAAPAGREEEEVPMNGKVKGLAALAGGLALSGIAGAAEPNADVAAVIVKIEARQAAKAEAAAADKAENEKLMKEARAGGEQGERVYYKQ